ncbi:MAG: UDP-N-acetylmuramoyl-L-alanine--D-glutamate ligase [Verrucomicrobiota bacterium]
MKCKGMKVAVLGLGASGRAAAELLIEKGANVFVRDDELSERLESVAKTLRARGAIVELGERTHAVCRFDLGILSPGISEDVPLVKQLRAAQTPIIGELELASRFCECPIIAITGTNGKSTTTELIAAILTAGGKKTIACGNLGQAFSSVAAKSAGMDAMTVEASSFQLETIAQFRPKIAVYLNFTPDHLDRYRSLEEYRAAKDKIFLNQTKEDYAVINSAGNYPKLSAKQITFNALGFPADYTFEKGWLTHKGKNILRQDQTHLRGPHNAENQLAALAVGDICEIPRPHIIEALCAYRALPHRCEVVRVLNGVTYINDSKATNIDAMKKALRGEERPVVLIAGGKDKGFDFSGIRELVKQKVHHAILIGEVQEKLFSAWSGAVKCHRAASLEEAVQMSRKLARSGDAVLLSPGCSSYDMFENFEERGEVFRQETQKL